MLNLILGQRGQTPLRVLCLGSHSDDLEIGCGGTLLSLAASRPGVNVDWVVFSASEDRAAEARRSAMQFRAACRVA